MVAVYRHLRAELRIEYPGALYHVMARGNDRHAIFKTLLRRGGNNAGRDTAIYLCREVGQKGLRKIGEIFGVKSAAVSLVAKRVKDRLRKDELFER